MLLRLYLHFFYHFFGFTEENMAFTFDLHVDEHADFQ